MTDRLTEEREAEIRASLEATFASVPGERARLTEDTWQLRCESLLAELDAARDELREARERLKRQEATICELWAERDDLDGVARARFDYMLTADARVRELEASIPELREGAVRTARLRTDAEMAVAEEHIRSSATRQAAEDRAEAADVRVRELEASIAELREDLNNAKGGGS